MNTIDLDHSDYSLAEDRFLGNLPLDYAVQANSVQIIKKIRLTCDEIDIK